MDTNRASLAYAPQTVFGTVDASPAFVDQNFTGEDLQHQKETVQSAIIKADRNVLDLIEVGAMANGSFNFELILAGAFDWLFAAGLMTAPVIVSQTVAVTFALAGQTMTIDAGTWAVTPIAGMYLKISSAVDVGNNGLKRVLSATTTVVTFEPGSLTADESADSVTLKGTAWRNGVTRVINTLERRATNGTDTFYQAYNSSVVDELTLDLVSKQVTKGSAKWMGKAGDSRDAILASATYAAANTNKPVNATTHVARLERAGSVLSEKLKTFGFSVKNNCRYKDAIGESGPFDIGLGKCEVTGKMQAYFESKALLDAFIAHTYASLAAIQTDPNGNSFAVFLPSAVFASGTPKAPGENQDMMQDLDFQAIYSSAHGASIVISVITP